MKRIKSLFPVLLVLTACTPTPEPTSLPFTPTPEPSVQVVYSEAKLVHVGERSQECGAGGHAVYIHLYDPLKFPITITEPLTVETHICHDPACESVSPQPESSTTITSEATLPIYPIPASNFLGEKKYQVWLVWSGQVLGKSPPVSSTWPSFEELYEAGYCACIGADKEACRIAREQKTSPFARGHYSYDVFFYLVHNLRRR